jgi:hypothetical protein
MKKNRIALIVVLVLGVVAFWLIRNNGKGTIKEKLRDFAVKDTASITKIFLADKTGKKVTLTRENESTWMVDKKFYARQDAVNTLLYTIYSIEVKQPVGKKAQDNIVKSLASGATKIEIYSGEDLVKMYYIGGETQDQMGTYMLLANEETGENSSVPFVTYIPGFDGYLTTRYFTEASDWRDRSVFKYVPNQIKTVKVEYPSSPTESFTIIKKAENIYEVRDVQTNTTIPDFDTIAIKQYLSYYQDIHFEAIERDMAKVNKDSVLASTPFAVLTVTNDAGMNNVAKLFHKKAEPGTTDQQGNPRKYDIDRAYGLVNNGQDFVLCQYYVFGKLLQSPEYFSRHKNVVKK